MSSRWRREAQGECELVRAGWKTKHHLRRPEAEPCPGAQPWTETQPCLLPRAHPLTGSETPTAALQNPQQRQGDTPPAWKGAESSFSSGGKLNSSAC